MCHLVLGRYIGNHALTNPHKQIPRCLGNVAGWKVKMQQRRKPLVLNCLGNHLTAAIGRKAINLDAIDPEKSLNFAGCGREDFRQFQRLANAIRNLV
jgi:hypothetical protein